MRTEPGYQLGTITGAQENGLFVGISSGANVHASSEVARRLDIGEVVVTVRGQILQHGSVHELRAMVR